MDSVQLKLHPGEVHIWRISISSALKILTSSENSKRVIPQSERAYAESCALSRRNEFLASRWFLRRLLSSYDSSVAADEWKFETNEFGKPSIAGGSRLRFNISHSGDRIALAISESFDMGIDVERRRDLDPLQLADSFFAEREISDLRVLSGASQLNRFFQYWTLKEAFIKAVGRGLSLPLDAFSFHANFGPSVVHDRDDLVVSLDQSLSWADGQWKIRLLSEEPEYYLAIAIPIRTDQSTDIVLIERDFDSALLPLTG